MQLSLVLGGNWNLSLGQRLDGDVNIRREGGDVLMPGEPGAALGPVALGLGELELKLAARENHVVLRAHARGSRLGSVSARGATTLSRRDGAWGVDGSAPVEGDAEVAMQTLAWLAPLVSPALAGDGALNMRLELRGTAGAPRFAGRIDGDRLLLEAPDQGVYLRNGVLRAELADDGARIRELSFDSGAGRLTASGEARLREGSPRATLAIAADKAELVSRPDRLLIVSGQTTADMADGQLRIAGKLLVDRGMIELPRAELPTLSDDVEIVGGDETEKRKAGRLRPDVDMEIDLGKQFFLKGRGLDAQLAGAVRVRGSGAGLPLASGIIRVEKGDYYAYGQRLAIERGILSFAGPLDNPGLNIVAMRKNQEVEAGVAITGTALSPQVRLVSNPPVPDGEKMSWLVLGHGLEGSSGSELDLMGAAASALLATGESVSLQSEIAHAAGLDEFGLSGSGGLANTAVTLGKRLSSRAYLSYEQSVAGADSLVKVNYLLTPRWSVRAQGGTDNAVDLFYTLSFD
jgi:translocation and assembly module TamB